MSRKSTQTTRRLIRELRDVAVDDAYRRETLGHKAKIYLINSERSQADGPSQQKVKHLLESL